MNKKETRQLNQLQVNHS